MKRFNQYINGEREFKKTMEPIQLKDPEGKLYHIIFSRQKRKPTEVL